MNTQKYKDVLEQIKPFGARLVAVSKTKPVSDILALYNQGQRLFGENKVQEIVQKHEALPKDIEWHFIGHLQTNKVKLITPFVAMIHGVDSLKLLSVINSQAQKNGRVIKCLLQIFIADEQTKFGLTVQELQALLQSNEFKQMANVQLCGLMGMATNTDDEQKIEQEFASLQQMFVAIKNQYFSSDAAFKELSMGMSSDYHIALRNGATLIRIGSSIFGERS